MKYSEPNEVRKNPVLKHVSSGKVRDLYEPSGIIFKTSDRISAFDQVLGEVQYKGNALNCVSTYCKMLLEDKGISTDLILEPEGFFEVMGFSAEDVKKCSYVKSLDMLPFEVIVRAILTGSAAEAHKKGESYCGYTFPKEMKEGDRFTSPIVTLTTKEKDGHDQPITIEDAYERLADYCLDIGFGVDLGDPEDFKETAGTFLPLTKEATDWVAKKMFEKDVDEGNVEEGCFDEDSLEDYASIAEDIHDNPEWYNLDEAWEVLALYAIYLNAVDVIDLVCELALDAFSVIASNYDSKGFILVDSKFEFGIDDDGNIVVADEVGTMDSSRIIDKDIFLMTRKMVNHDKQPARDDLKAKGFTGKDGQEFPGFSEGVLEQTSRNYVTTCIELTTPEFAKEFLPEEAFAL